MHVAVPPSCSRARPGAGLPLHPCAARPPCPLQPACHWLLQGDGCCDCSLPLQPVQVVDGCSRRQAWLLLCMHASEGGRGRAGGGPGVGGPAWQRGGRATARGALQWGRGASAQHVLPPWLGFGWNWRRFRPKRWPFGLNRRWFGPNEGRFGSNERWFGPNWGSPKSNMHACGCAALLQPRQAWRGCYGLPCPPPIYWRRPTTFGSRGLPGLLGNS